MTMPIAHQPVTDFAYVIENHMIGKIGLMELELTPRARFGRAITAYIDRFGGPAMPTVCGLDDRPAEVAAVLEWAVARGKPASSRELWLEVVGKPPPQPGDVLV